MYALIFVHTVCKYWWYFRIDCRVVPGLEKVPLYPDVSGTNFSFSLRLYTEQIFTGSALHRLQCMSKRLLNTPEKKASR